MINQIRVGKHRDLFDPQSLLCGSEGASSTYARGHGTVGKSMLDAAVDQIRLLADGCSGLCGFILTHALGGGTGSGFASLLAEQLDNLYGRKQRTGICVYPGPELPAAVVEPYNVVLSQHALQDHMDVTLVVDNEACTTSVNASC